MSTLGMLFAIGAAGLLTFFIRLSMIALWGKWTPPSWIPKVLLYIPPAVLAAILFPEILLREGRLSLLPPDNLRLPAALLAGVVAWRTRSTVWTILAGMAVLLVLQAIAGL